MGGGSYLYRISCLASSHFFSHNPSVLQSELFGHPGRWQIGLVKGAAMIPTLQPHTPTFTYLPSQLTPQCVSKHSLQTSWHQPCPRCCRTAVPLLLLFNDIYSELCCWCFRLCACQQGWMDGVALIVNHCRLCWLSGSWSNGVSIFHYRTMTNEHVNTYTHTQTHTYSHTYTWGLHLPLIDLWQWPALQVAPYTVKPPFADARSSYPSIHLSLTRCCESTDNLLSSPHAALIAPFASGLPSSQSHINYMAST